MCERETQRECECVREGECGIEGVWVREKECAREGVCETKGV